MKDINLIHFAMAMVNSIIKTVEFIVVIEYEIKCQAKGLYIMLQEKWHMKGNEVKVCLKAKVLYTMKK